MKNIYFILGMHRSGTSLTAQILEKMGVWFGEEEWLLPANKGNPRGYYELKRLVEINDLWLAENNLTWKSIGKIENTSIIVKESINDFKKDYLNNDNMAIKDPRLSLLWKKWGELIEDNIRGITVVRNPFEVAKSLEQRDDMDLEYAYCLWYYYNWKCLQFSLEYDNLFLMQYEFFDFFDKQCNKIWKYLYGNELQDYNGYNEVVVNKFRHYKEECFEAKTKIQKIVVDFYKDLIALSEGRKQVLDVIDRQLMNYKVILQEQEKIEYSIIEKDFARRLHIYMLSEFFGGYMIRALKRKLFDNNIQIVLCGNGRNLLRVLPIFEKSGINVKCILDKFNLSEREYERGMLKVYKYKDMKLLENNDNLYYVITPNGSDKDEIYNELITYVDKERIIFLSAILGE
ncbi:MAG: hypothetical protein IJA34_04980 [Lachnospiraceae bacterium]|nr:hypothetical protein [Lachnospiraceae bacterium]